MHGSGLVEPAVEAVDDEPVLLKDSTAKSIRIENMTLSSDGPEIETPKACFYEITLSGFGLDDSTANSNDEGTESDVHVFAERYVRCLTCFYPVSIRFLSCFYATASCSDTCQHLCKSASEFCRYLVTPWQLGSRRGLAAQSLIPSAGGARAVSVGASLASMEMGVDGDDTLTLTMPGMRDREIVVDVRRVGRACASPSVSEGF